MKGLKKLRTSFGTSVELIRALWHGRFWWLVPLVLTLLPLAVIFVLLQSVPLVAPFVYALF